MMQRFSYIRNVSTLQLDREICTGCGRCIEVCPHHVFAMYEGGARIAMKDSCIECGACARNCAAGAITVDAGVGCASGLINEWLRERKIMSGGSCC